jgi:hypothetical protein
MNDKSGIKGVIRYTLFDKDGNVKQQGETYNIVTDQGDDYYVDRLSDQGAGTAKQFHLGTGTATPAKANTWVSGYYSNNGTAIAGSGAVAVTTHPTGGSENTLRYTGTFVAGYSTQDGITRIGLSNMNPAADGNGTPNATTTMFIAHGTINPTVNKGASDSLVVTWDHTFLGA